MSAPNSNVDRFLVVRIALTCHVKGIRSVQCVVGNGLSVLRNVLLDDERSKALVRNVAHERGKIVICCKIKLASSSVAREAPQYAASSGHIEHRIISRGVVVPKVCMPSGYGKYNILELCILIGRLLRLLEHVGAVVETLEGEHRVGTDISVLLYDLGSVVGLDLFERELRARKIVSVLVLLVYVNLIGEGDDVVPRQLSLVGVVLTRRVVGVGQLARVDVALLAKLGVIVEPGLEVHVNNAEVEARVGDGRVASAGPGHTHGELVVVHLGEFVPARKLVAVHEHLNAVLDEVERLLHLVGKRHVVLPVARHVVGKRGGELVRHLVTNVIVGTILPAALLAGGVVHVLDLLLERRLIRLGVRKHGLLNARVYHAGVAHSSVQHESIRRAFGYGVVYPDGKIRGSKFLVGLQSEVSHTIRELHRTVGLVACRVNRRIREGYGEVEELVLIFHATQQKLLAHLKSTGQALVGELHLGLLLGNVTCISILGYFKAGCTLLGNGISNANGQAIHRGNLATFEFHRGYATYKAQGLVAIRNHVITPRTIIGANGVVVQTHGELKRAVLVSSRVGNEHLREYQLTRLALVGELHRRRASTDYTFRLSIFNASTRIPIIDGNTRQLEVGGALLGNGVVHTHWQVNGSRRIATRQRNRSLTILEVNGRLASAISAAQRGRLRAGSVVPKLHIERKLHVLIGCGVGKNRLVYAETTRLTSVRAIDNSGRSIVHTACLAAPSSRNAFDRFLVHRVIHTRRNTSVIGTSRGVHGLSVRQ